MRGRAIASWLVVLVAVGCSSEPAMVRQMRKVRLIGAIQHQILTSVAAEKSAVLATTDEESQALAGESQNAAAKINELRGELRTLIVADQRKEELEKLDTFDASWAEVERVDERLLRLAVANTNLKATRLLARDGATALDHFIDSINDMERSAPDPNTIRALSRASVAALRDYSLLLIHIPSPDDAEMTRLEEHMRDLNAEIDRSLALASESGQLSPELMAAASQSLAEYRKVSAEVVRLSRQNTNVISFDVSVHEKRHVTQDCLAALSALLATVDLGPKATR